MERVRSVERGLSLNYVEPETAEKWCAPKPKEQPIQQHPKHHTEQTRRGAKPKQSFELEISASLRESQEDAERKVEEKGGKSNANANPTAKECGEVASGEEGVAVAVAVAVVAVAVVWG